MKETVRKLLPRRLKAHRILAGPLRGAKIVTSWHDYPGAILGRTERPLLGWFQANVQPGQTWLDIGAHYGYTAIALARLVGPKGRVFAFEPQLASVGCLSQTRTINRLAHLTVVPMALGTSPVPTRKNMQSVRGMIDRTYQAPAGAAGAIEETFLESSLDALWQGLTGPRPEIDGIKIDVQGAEIEALTGMRNVLERWRPALVVELHAGVSRTQFLELLESLGYDPACAPVEPLPGENKPLLADDRSYAFKPHLNKLG